MTSAKNDYMGMGESAYTDAAFEDSTKIVPVPKGHVPTVVPTGPTAGILSMMAPPPKSRDLSQLEKEAKRIGHQFGGTQDAQGKSRAIYSFPAGQSNIEGATVWLIEALLQAYGHCAAEMYVEEDPRDINRITIVSTIVDFVNSVAYRRPHVASLAPAPSRFANKHDQIERWRSMQVQSAISKAGRTAMQHALPAWYVDTAIAAAREAMSSRLLTDKATGRRVTLKQAIDVATSWYEHEKNVSVPELEALLELERPMWTLSELAYLRETSARLTRGETTIAELFGAEKVAEPTVTAGEAEKMPAAGLDALKPAAAAAKAPEAAKAASPTTTKAEPAKAADAKAADPAKAPVTDAPAKTAAKDGGLF